MNNEVINKEVDEKINNLEEDYHSNIEGISTKYIDQILQKDLSFYESRRWKTRNFYII
ncbi:MAG: hypothetical protein IPK06_04455 [Ignavibacteriae bacterium]|nr:hypothetical protein [Ignavibacteriota bacterium]